MAFDGSLPRSTPEAHGIPSAAILGFVDAIEQREVALHSLMLLRHGHVVAEGWWRPYAPDRPHMFFSLSKSFTSSAIGLAVAEGRLSVDDLVLGFFPDDAPPEIGANLAAMRVRHLLSMSTGHDEDTTGPLHYRADGNWTRAFLAQPVVHEPGTHFVYNSGATYMLSAIIQTLTGVTVLDYLQPRLLTPLGITGATWETSPRGINTGGWGLSSTTTAIAHLGQLYLDNGAWQGQRLLSKEWVAEATRWHVDNGPNPSPDWEQGYGYQFWRNRHDSYRGDGAFGQYCVVLPDQDAVLAMTGGLGDMQVVLDLVWEHLLPAMGEPRPEDAAAHDRLRERLGRLRLATPVGQKTSPRAARVSGQTYRFDANDQQIDRVRLDFTGDDCTLTVHNRHGEQRIACGADDWREGDPVSLPNGHQPERFETGGPRPIAAYGTWIAEDTYVVAVSFYETPFSATITCHFTGDQLTFQHRVSVGFDDTERPQLIGRLDTVA